MYIKYITKTHYYETQVKDMYIKCINYMWKEKYFVTCMIRSVSWYAMKRKKYLQIIFLLDLKIYKKRKYLFEQKRSQCLWRQSM